MKGADKVKEGKIIRAIRGRAVNDLLDEAEEGGHKGMKEAIQAHAEANGETVNGFINRLINDALGVHKTADADADI